MKHPFYPDGVTRDDLAAWFRAGRERTRRLFAIPVEEAYFDRPIELRNPIVFYEGHLPAFSINTLMKLALRKEGIDEHYELLFARGIDPDSPDAAKSPTDVWPKRSDVQQYGATADAMLESALRSGAIEGDTPQTVGAEAALTILEHEEMHQETLLYMFHNLPYERKVAQEPFNFQGPGTRDEGRGVERGRVHIPGGRVTLGASREEQGFGWDNEFPSLTADVDEFVVDRHNVTNGEYLDYMRATGAPAPHFWLQHDGAWHWRGMFAPIPLPLDWPVYATQEEATAFAAWRGGRIMTEAEYHRAAYGTPEGEERLQPWGDAPADASRGNFDFHQWDPVPVGSYPDGASAWGVHDLVGNGWEWTSTRFGGFPGFAPMASYPVYSADFFDDKHFVLKGASPATAAHLVRRSFRNWFRGNYPYVYATFRVVGGS